MALTRFGFIVTGGRFVQYQGTETFSMKVVGVGLKCAGRDPSRDALIDGLETIQNASFGGFNVNFGPRPHTASRFVELSMLSEYGKVRC